MLQMSKNTLLRTDLETTVDHTAQYLESLSRVAAASGAEIAVVEGILNAAEALFCGLDLGNEEVTQEKEKGVVLTDVKWGISRGFVDDFVEKFADGKRIR